MSKVGYTMRKCCFCEFEFVGPDDERIWQHIEEEHSDTLKRAWKLGTAE